MATHNPERGAPVCRHWRHLPRLSAQRMVGGRYGADEFLFLGSDLPETDRQGSRLPSGRFGTPLLPNRPDVAQVAAGLLISQIGTVAATTSISSITAKPRLR